MNATWTDILWFLAIGAFFLMMMRKGGCCGGHGHKKPPGESAADPHDQHSRQQTLPSGEVVPENVVRPAHPEPRRLS